MRLSREQMGHAVSLALTLAVHRADGRTDSIPVTLRLDTPAEVDYVRHGGIMPYVLSEITKAAAFPPPTRPSPVKGEGVPLARR